MIEIKESVEAEMRVEAGNGVKAVDGAVGWNCSEVIVSV